MLQLDGLLDITVPDVGAETTEGPLGSDDLAVQIYRDVSPFQDPLFQFCGQARRIQTVDCIMKIASGVAAELPGFFHQVDLYAALGEGEGGMNAGDAATDDKSSLIDGKVIEMERLRQLEPFDDRPDFFRCPTHPVDIISFTQAASCYAQQVEHVYQR